MTKDADAIDTPSNATVVKKYIGFRDILYTPFTTSSFEGVVAKLQQAIRKGKVPRMNITMPIVNHVLFGAIKGTPME